MQSQALLAGIDVVVAALPFLPRGRGALILIFGGMMVLVISLLWSVLVPRKSSMGPSESEPGRRASASGSRPALARTAATTLAGIRKLPAWLAGVMEMASRADL